MQHEAAAHIEDWGPLGELSHPEPPPVPAIFPADLQTFVDGVAESTQTPREFATAGVLATLAGCIQGKFRFRINDGWAEDAPLWTVLISPPGTGKSPAWKEVKAPLLSWETHQAVSMASEVRASQSERETMLALIARKRAEVAKIDNPEEFKRESERLADLELKLPEATKVPRPSVGDCTTEALAAVLVHNGEAMNVEGVTLLDDEGVMLKNFAGKYNKGVASFELPSQAWSGSGCRVDRRSGEPVHLRAPVLSIGLAIQPGILARFNANSEARDQGFIYRFLFFYPPSTLGKRRFDAKTVSPLARARYARLVEQLLDHQPSIGDDGLAIPECIPLNAKSRAVLEEFFYSVENRIAPGGDLETLAAWGSKLHANTVRIAGLLTVVDSFLEGSERNSITETAAKRAVTLSRTLIEHARYAFDAMGLDETTVQANQVLDWIKYEGLTQFTQRDCQRRFHGMFKKATEMRPALALLHEINAIRTGTEKTGGRPSKVYFANPRLSRQI